MKKCFALLLSLALALPLVSCGKDQSGENTSSPSPSVSSSAPSPSAPAAFDVNDYTRALAGVDADTVMFTVNGEDVNAEYFFYWLAYNCYNWASTYPMYYGTELDFDSLTPTGEVFSQYIKDDARTGAAVYVLLEQQAAANGCGLTDGQRAEWEQLKDNDRQADGGESFDLFLRQLGLSEPVFDRIATMNNYLYQNVAEQLTQPPFQEEAEQYAEDHSVYRAKHILIRTVIRNGDGSLSFYRGGAPTNEDGSAYTGTAEEYNAAALEQANALLAQLSASDDPIALFDQLMAEHSEDAGSSSNPDGYVFGPDEMVAEFEGATAGLDYGAFTAEPVLSDFGYHIILRLRPRPEDVEDDFRTDRMNALIDGWLSEAEIVSTGAYDALDTGDFYEKYQAYQQSFSDAEEGVSPSPES